MSEKLKELQHALQAKGPDWLRSRVGDLRLNALRALATELCLSVDGVTLKHEFVTLVCKKLEVQSLVQRMKSVARA